MFTKDASIEAEMRARQQLAMMKPRLGYSFCVYYAFIISECDSLGLETIFFCLVSRLLKILPRLSLLLPLWLAGRAK